jgi:hypothetical protein
MGARPPGALGGLKRGGRTKHRDSGGAADSPSDPAALKDSYAVDTTGNNLPMSQREAMANSQMNEVGKMPTSLKMLGLGQKRGGKVPMKAGSISGEGRLQKAEHYGAKARG